MGKSERKRDPIPEHFKSLDDAAGFWDSHDLADYWDQTSEASFEVDLLDDTAIPTSPERGREK